MVLWGCGGFWSFVRGFTRDEWEDTGVFFQFCPSSFLMIFAAAEMASLGAWIWPQEGARRMRKKSREKMPERGRLPFLPIPSHPLPSPPIRSGGLPQKFGNLRKPPLPGLKNARYQTKNARYQTKNARYQTKNARCQTKNARCQTENARCQTENARCQTEKNGCCRHFRALRRSRGCLRMAPPSRQETQVPCTDGKP